MQENDFEKQVHQKMGELHIQPSETVWAQVEMRLHNKEKRRRWILWLPLLLAGLSLGGYLVKRAGSNQQKTSLHITSTGPLHTEKNNISKTVGKEYKSLGDHAKSNRQEINNDKKTDLVQNAPPVEPVTQETVSHKSSVTKQKEETSIRIRKEKFSTPTSDHAVTSTVFTKSPARKFKHSEIKNVDHLLSTALLNQEPALNTKIDQQNIPAEIIAKADPASVSEKELFPANVTPVYISSNPANIVSPLTNTELAGKINISFQQNKIWEWGIYFEGGRSSITSGTSLNKFLSSSLAYSSPGTGLSSGTSPVYKELYPLRASAGFSAGAFLKKQLKGRVSISAGINYTYYSSSNKIGVRVDSAIIVPSSLNSSQVIAGQYFRLGNTGSFVNKYHFIEIPVVVQTKLTRYWKVPLYWDLGISVSRLITSNALYFDNTKDVYYNNNELLNKTQFNIITGLPVKFLQGKKYGFELGPELKYGLSQVLTKEAASGTHFLFLGIKAGFVIGRK